MWEACLPTVLVGDLLPGGALAGCGLREVVGLLVACSCGVGWDPPGGDLIVPGHDPGVDLTGRDCKALSWAEGVCPDPVDGRH